ncbi:hypothetical protein L227DRAFT_65260 [Lentinus tigrinus ALCF2SS1-6]|uniref:Uncharacterized protein n=1 Tax=Lentinus tigrinus ALCF2SS1-6 TaxID=1328759 RepID=A0A5C2SC43_9APHY|nr:hypothetical protein L227DRAFT_65260 [Lentinus tigrinus ALCF2SS1-6]
MGSVTSEFHLRWQGSVLWVGLCRFLTLGNSGICELTRLLRPTRGLQFRTPCMRACVDSKYLGIQEVYGMVDLRPLIFRIQLLYA